MIASITVGTPSPAGGVDGGAALGGGTQSVDPNGFAVFVTEGTGDTVKVHTQDVTLGNTYGNMIAVKSGLRWNDRVVTRAPT